LRRLGDQHERLERLTARLGAQPARPQRVDEAVRASDASDDLRQLVDEVLTSPSRAHAVALLNERLSEVAADLDYGAEVPRSAARICALSATALALMALITSLPRLETVAVPIGVALAAGVVGAGVTWQLGALARARGERQRHAWNELVRRLTPLLPPDPLPKP
jgi:hypothetical protein